MKTSLINKETPLYSFMRLLKVFKRKEKRWQTSKPKKGTKEYWFEKGMLCRGIARNSLNTHIDEDTSDEEKKIRYEFAYNDYEEAISYFDKAIDIDPEYITAWFEKGLTYTNSYLNRNKEAIECLERVAELEDLPPSKNQLDKFTWNWCGEELSKLDRHESAMKCFQKARELGLTES